MTAEAIKIKLAQGKAAKLRLDGPEGQVWLDKGEQFLLDVLSFVFNDRMFEEHHRTWDGFSKLILEDASGIPSLMTNSDDAEIAQKGQEYYRLDYELLASIVGNAQAIVRRAVSMEH